MKRIRWGTVAVFALVATAAVAVRQERKEVPEYEAKAAILYNFCVYAEWPAGAFAADNSPITIGIVGKDPFGEALEKTIKDHTAQTRKIEILRFESVKVMKPCHLVFLPATEKANLSDLTARLKGSNTLLVGESDGFASKGGVVNLVLEEKRIRLESNPDAAERAGIKLGAKLLKLSKIVKDEK